jgi:hypothetical protein
LPSRNEDTTSAQLLELLAANWSGTYRLWLEPEVLRVQGDSSCTGRRLFGGRFVALEYDWTDLDGPQSGSMLLGCADDGTWQMAWIDTWHNGNSITFSTGTAAIDVLCSYGPPDEPWGWRTTFDVSPEELVITAWNVTPGGEAAKATEAAYRRAG